MVVSIVSNGLKMVRMGTQIIRLVVVIIMVIIRIVRMAAGYSV